jgi:hypothetical protein
LTRYSALYTSLTTNYVLESESDTAMILPFSTDPGFEPRIHDRITPVSLRRDRTVRLTGFPVISNSTGIVHSEQMYDVGGTLALSKTPSGDYQLVNSSELQVRDAVVLWHRDDGTFQIAALGTVRSQETVPLPLKELSSGLSVGELWQDSPVMCGKGLESGEVGLQRMAEIAVQQLPLRGGEARLVGWTEQNWDGFSIRPEANQTVTRTLILAHLQPGLLPPAQPDVNLYIDIVADDERRTLTDEDLDESVEDFDLLPDNPE